MDFISEDSIKTAALSFFKTYYKHRRRIGETEARANMGTEDGIIADGLLRFPVEVGKEFVATFEATSVATAHEVKYQTRSTRLWWDSAMVGTLLTAIVFAWLYGLKTITIGHDYVWTAAIFVLIAICFFTLAYRLIFRNIKAYRQIYAVEQFKLYHADEQWIVIGEDVFNDRGNKYMKELRRQCVNHGFGLLVVENDTDIRKIVTPSLDPMDGEKRKRGVFSPLAPEEAGKEHEKIATKGKGFRWDRENRFKYKFWWQLAFLLLGFLIIFGILLKEWRDKPVLVVDDSEKYKKQRRQILIDSEPETRYFFIDSGMYVIPFNDSISGYDLDQVAFYDFEDDYFEYRKWQQDSLDEARRQNLTPEQLDSLVELWKNKKDEASIASVTPKQKGKKKKGIPTVCLPYAKWYGPQYICKDGVYSTRSAAEFRISQINKAGLVGHWVRGGCFRGYGPCYIVYIERLYGNKNSAAVNLPYFDTRLKEQGYSAGDLELQRLKLK